MNTFVDLVRNEVGEMTNDFIDKAQVSTERKLGFETRYWHLDFQVSKLSPEEEKKIRLEQEKR